MSDADTPPAEADKRPSILDVSLLVLVLVAVIYFFVCLFRTCVPFLGRYWMYLT